MQRLLGQLLPPPLPVPHPPPPIPILPSAHSTPLHVLEENVPEQLVQLTFRFLPRLSHGAAVALGGGRAPPSEVAHPIGAVLPRRQAHRGLGLVADPLRSLAPTPFLQVPRFVLVEAQLPASQGGEAALGGAPSLQGGGEHLHGATLAARWFAPAEMLHGVGAPRVAEASQVRLWYLVFGNQGGQDDAEREVAVVAAHLQGQRAEPRGLRLDGGYAAADAVLYGGGGGQRETKS